MTKDEIKRNAPDGAQYYCEYPTTCYDKPKSYLKSYFKILFRWNGYKWEFICFPFNKNDFDKSNYIQL